MFPLAQRLRRVTCLLAAAATLFGAVVMSAGAVPAVAFDPSQAPLCSGQTAPDGTATGAAHDHDCASCVRIAAAPPAVGLLAWVDAGRRAEAPLIEQAWQLGQDTPHPAARAPPVR